MEPVEHAFGHGHAHVGRIVGRVGQTFTFTAVNHAPADEVQQTVIDSWAEITKKGKPFSSGALGPVGGSGAICKSQGMASGTAFVQAAAIGPDGLVRLVSLPIEVVVLAPGEKEKKPRRTAKARAGAVQPGHAPIADIGVTVSAEVA